MIAILITAQLALLGAQAAAAPPPLLHPAPPPASGRASVPDPKSPRVLNMQEVVTDEDYPEKALQAEEQGPVQIEVKVSAKGVPESCAVKSSSGSETLDARTCELFMTRARYAPAHNVRGKAVSGRAKHFVTWALNNGAGQMPTYPRSAWTSHYTMILAADGTVRGCSTQTPLAPQVTCRAGTFPADVAAQFVKTTGTELAEFRSEEAFSPSDPAPVPPMPPGMSLLSRRIVRLTISPDGNATCEPLAPGLDKPGEMSACDQANFVHFAKVPDTEGKLVGALAISVYLGPGHLPASDPAK
jgi:TonB family protein